jgi:hypothetical protein
MTLYKPMIIELLMLKNSARNDRQQIVLQIDQLILCNGSMFIELSKLHTIQKL